MPTGSWTGTPCEGSLFDSRVRTSWYGFPGVDGIYDFKKYPQRGVGPQSSTVTTYDATKKAWTWLSKPGGEPLSK